jgi:NRAMP (natural resistance-associated macrophage protein)-like metal ion transporter
MAGTPQSNSNTPQSNSKKGEKEAVEAPLRWEPSGNRWQDLWNFVGPGWMVCVAYVDPGNYQANINAGATNGYRLLYTIWWMSLLSMYCQVLCVRLATYAQVTLSEAQAMNQPRWLRYLNWAIAEFSAVITDIPEVIGIGIALQVFFGWPYVVGVLLSYLTTMGFLAVQSFGMKPLEAIVAALVGIMGITIIVESFLVGIDGPEYLKGWCVGFIDFEPDDTFAIIGIIGAVVMPHNLYLHSASARSRLLKRSDEVVRQACTYMSWEPLLPILVSFFISAAVVSISAEKIQGQKDADTAGLTNFYSYVENVPGSRWLWGLSLLAAGQSSAITTTYAGQYVMDGFLKIRLAMWKRALLTRTIAILPCVVVSIFLQGSALNQAVNIVNGSLCILLPFALTPLVKYTTSTKFMGDYASGPVESVVAWSFAFAVYLVNAVSLALPGGGFFGDMLFTGLGNEASVEMGFEWAVLFILMMATEIFMLGWNVYMVYMPIVTEMPPFATERVLENEFTTKLANEPQVTTDAREIHNFSTASADP